MQLHRRDVDAQLEGGRERGAPLRHLLRGLLEHPVAQRHDQARLLGQRDEFARADHAAQRLVPADECFGLDDAAAGDFHDGLVVQLEFLPVQPLLQVAQQQAAVLRFLLHGRRELAKLVAPLFLGCVHRQVGVLEQVHAVVAVARVEGQPGADRDVHGVAAQFVGLGHGVQHLAADGVRVHRMAQILQDERELIAAQARHQVGAAHAGLQAACHLAQQLVALIVAEGVVHFLEEIQVQEHQCERLAALACPLHAVQQVLLEHLPVGQLGQVVVVRLVPDRGLGPALLRHIGEQADVAVHAAVLVVRGVDGQPLDVFLAVLAPVADIAAPRPTLAQAGPQGLVEGAVLAARAENVQAPTNDLVRCVAGDGGESRVQILHHALGVGHHHGLGGVLVDQRRTARRGLGALALGDVHHHADDGRAALERHDGAEDLDLERRAVGAQQGALVARAVHQAVQTLQHAPAHLHIGLGREQARQREAAGQRLAWVAGHACQLFVGVDDVQLLVEHVDARHLVLGQAVEHGLHLRQRGALLGHVVQQLVDVRGRVVQRPCQLAQLVAAGERYTRAVVALSHLTALAREDVDGPQHAPRQQRVAQREQQHVEREQRQAAVQRALVRGLGEAYELVEQRFGLFKQRVARGDGLLDLGAARRQRGLAQRVDGLAVALPAGVQGLQHGAQLRVERLDLHAVGAAAVAQRGVGGLERGVVFLGSGPLALGALARGQGLQSDALAQHAHLPRHVDGGRQVVGAAQQHLDGDDVAHGQQGHQERRPQRLAPERARPGQQMV